MSTLQNFMAHNVAIVTMPIVVKSLYTHVQ